MKVSLITIKGLYNYGAVLQAYATYEYLRKLNCNVEVIDYYPNYFEAEISFIKKVAIQLLTAVKRYKINRFIKSNMQLTNKTYTSFNQIKAGDIKADSYIVGSDQVWNSQLSQGKLDPAYFLDYVTDVKNKIAFASSIGRTDVNENELKEMKNYLQEFQHISVREESAKKLLESAGVENVVNVLDPVFLLTKKDYEKFIKPVSYKKYLLIYSFEKNYVLQTLAFDIAEKLNLQIIEVGIFKSKYTCDIYVQNAGIEDFLSLMNNAEFVITSSFHGTAFSILLNKLFVSVAPSVRKTRLENITNIFGISNRLISEKDRYVLEDLLEPIDYEKTNELVELYSNKTRDFLKNAIGFKQNS